MIDLSREQAIRGADKVELTAVNGRLEGVGHSAMFRDKDGNLRIVFHAHKAPGKVHPREMYISPVSFTGDSVPVMQISADNIIKAVKCK